MFRSILAATFVVALIAVPMAEAKPTSTCGKAYGARTLVKKRYGTRAPGRNICRFGVKLTNHKIVKATPKQKVRYYNTLRRLLRPPPAHLTKYAGGPPNAPSGTLTSRYKPSGLAACIVSHESGGNPNATNGQYHGIAQWSAEAWARHGGHKYAADPLGASYDQQLQVLSNGLKHYGCRDWCRYDGC